MKFLDNKKVLERIRIGLIIFLAILVVFNAFLLIFMWSTIGLLYKVVFVLCSSIHIIALKFLFNKDFIKDD